LSGETAQGFEAGDGTELHAVVKQLAAGVGSPQQISHRLVLDFPDGRSVRVSHEMTCLELFTPARAALRAGMVLLLVGHCSQPARQAASFSRRPARPRMVPIRPCGWWLVLRAIALIEQGGWGATRQSLRRLVVIGQRWCTCSPGDRAGPVGRSARACRLLAALGALAAMGSALRRCGPVGDVRLTPVAALVVRWQNRRLWPCMVVLRSTARRITAVTVAITARIRC